MTTQPINKLWLLARLVVLTSLGVVAIVFLSSWLVAVVVGGLTITAVAIDGWMLSRAQADRIAIDPSSDSAPSRPLTIDLSRRR